MSDRIPLNPDILRWARVTLDLSLEDVASRFNKKPEEIAAWERGESSPTYVQLETLAYSIYKRPMALFFFPAPPVEEKIEETFRTLPEVEIEKLPPRIRYLLRCSRVLQLNLYELYGGENPAEHHILRELSISPSIDASDMAGRVRNYLGISLSEQKKWDGAEDALKRWRDALEVHGVFVFKDSFNAPGQKRSHKTDSPFSGFCLYDAEFPIIYINNNKAKTRQTFTLFHELAHLMMRTGGIDTRNEDYIQYLTGDARRIEVLCNRFAAEFLVPSRDFDLRTKDKSIDEALISELADEYCVSREVILRRFFDWNRVTRAFYETKAKQYQADSDRSARSGGDHYRKKGAYLGERYVERVFSRYHQDLITLEQAAEYLGEKTKNVSRMEAWLFRQGTTA